MSAFEMRSGLQLLRMVPRMLARDWRAGELRMIASALVIAVGAFTTVAFFADRVGRALASEAGQLLGADLVVVSGVPLDPSVENVAREEGLRRVQAVRFPSMARSGERNVLAEVRSVSAGYPLRGRLLIRQTDTGPGAVADSIPEPGTVWVDERLMRRLELRVGSMLELGERRLAVAAIITEEPEASVGFINMGPRLMFNLADLPSTELIQTGSRVSYRLFVAGEENALAEFRARTMKILVAGQRIEDIRDARPEIKSALEKAERFLGLSALLTVILAGVAVALAARRYVQRHLDACAMMRCLGASQRYILILHALQLAAIGVAASLAGCGLGYLGQFGLAALLGSLVPVKIPVAGWLPVAQGLATGLVLLMGFALPPLIALKKVPALRVLRRNLGTPDSMAGLGYGLGLAAVAGLVFWQARDAGMGTLVLAGVCVMLAIAALFTLGVLYALGRIISATGASWRFGLANLRRNRMGTVFQVAAFAVGMMALILLTLVRSDLLQSWKTSLPPQAPNRFLVNIQPDQLAELRQFFSAHELALPPTYPMIRGRLVEINGTTVSSKDFVDDRARRLLDREFNLSWAEKLPSDNAMVKGQWFDTSQHGQPLVSIEDGVAATLGLNPGDTLGFMIAGKALSVRIASLRKVHWDSFRVNFYVLTPPGVLETHPASYITSLYLPASRAPVMDELVRQFPNLLVIDVAAILSQVQTMMDQVARAIEFVFVFSLAAGLLVLWSAIAATHQERVHDAAVMRTLGATRGQMRAVQAAEFALLGAVAGLLAAVGASVLGYVLAEEVLKVPFTVNPWVWIAGPVGGALCVMLAGLLGTARVLKTPPMQTLRAAG
jgi:putative ABC transport system permease protein